MNSNPPIFITGSTGYLGQALIAALLAESQQLYALVRPTASQLPAQVTTVIGDALNAGSYTSAVPQGATFVHLVGVSHPSPSKAAQFEQVDLASVKAALHAAQQAQAKHFIYVSVAQPAPVMHAYQAVRARAETLIRASGIPATIVRPWYVLGPGHRWPIVLWPLYKIAEWVPAWRDGARRLRCVTLAQMVTTLVGAIEQPPEKLRIVEVEEILRDVAGTTYL